MSRELIHRSKHLVFDSLSAKSLLPQEQWTSPTPNPADFCINFQNSDFTSGQIISLLPIDIHIPNLFNNVTTRNQTFQFYDAVGGVGGAGASITIIMPIGHYNVDEWCIEFTAQVAASASAVTVVTCVVNTITGLLAIDMSGPWSIELTEATTNACTSMLLGLTEEQFSGAAFIDSDGNNVITFSNPPAFQGPQVLAIHSNFLTSSNSVLGSNHQQFTLIDHVSLAETPFGLTKHHFIRTDNVREIPFPASTSLNSMELCIRDVEGIRLSLPTNQKVCYHFIASFGPDS